MPRHSHRKILEHSASVSIQDLMGYKLLNRGSVKATWDAKVTSTRRGLLADIAYTISIANSKQIDEQNHLQFAYNYKGEHVSFKHLIEAQPVHYGGHRYYFRCSATKNGEYCGRRLKALYFAGNVWACRHCLELVYNNCRNHRNDSEMLRNHADTLHKKAEKLKAYNHPRKALRLKEREYFYRLKADEAFGKHVMRVFGLAMLSKTKES